MPNNPIFTMPPGSAALTKEMMDNMVKYRSCTFNNTKDMNNTYKEFKWYIDVGEHTPDHRKEINKWFETQLKVDLRFISHNHKCYPAVGKNYWLTPTEVDELKDYIEINYYEFVAITAPFPEDWQIKVTPESRKVVGNWLDDNRIGGDRIYEKADWKYYTQKRRRHSHIHSTRLQGCGLITVEQFEYNVIKIHLNKEPMEKVFRVTRLQMQEIHAVACESWQEKIKNLVNEVFYVFSDNANLSNTTVSSMMNAADKSQLKVLRRVFPDWDRNIMLFNNPTTENGVVSDFAAKYLGRSTAMWLTSKANEDDLVGKSFTLTKEFTVVVEKYEGKDIITFKHRK